MTYSIEIQSLYGYWVNCNDIFELVKFEYKNLPDLPDAVTDLANFHQCFHRLTIAYGLLYVVIEGYLKLNIRDETIDSLLEKESYVDSLRLLRNSLFHYQKQPLPKKLMKFIEIKDSETWAKKLKFCFEKFFRTNLPIDTIIDTVQINHNKSTK